MSPRPFAWREHRWLAAALALACLLTLLFGWRLAATVVAWEERELRLQGWMTVGFVAHHWQVERSRLEAALPLAPTPGERPTLAALAAQRRPPARRDPRLPRARRRRGRDRPGMTSALLGLVAAHGALLVLALTGLSSVGLPLPGSLTLLAAGSFAASGELALGGVLAAGLVGSNLGDQVGYWFGAKGGSRALAWATRRGVGKQSPTLAPSRCAGATPATSSAVGWSARWRPR